MSYEWERLAASEGWKRLGAIYRGKLLDLQRRLIALALESPDAHVRGVAAEIQAIEDVLGSPEREMERSEGDAGQAD